MESKGKLITTGKATDEELKHLYTSAKAFVYPVSTDLYSPQIIEAMAMGVPVICSADGFGTEIDHDAARFMIPYDVDDICAAIEAVESNPEYRSKLIQGGKRFASKYSWEAAAGGVLELYRELLNQ